MKIDFHVHTCEFSNCADSTAEEQVKAAISRGIDVVFFTDHRTLFPLDRIRKFNQKYAPFRVYQGIEITTVGTNSEDVLVLGIHEEALEYTQWSYEELYHYVCEKGGAMILAHPYRFSNDVNPMVWKYPPHAIEILSSNLSHKTILRRENLALRLDRPSVTNSDSHSTKTTGCYYNIFPETCTSETSIIEAILKGDFIVG